MSNHTQEQHNEIDQQQIELIRQYKFDHSGDFRDLCDKPIELSGDELAASFDKPQPARKVVEPYVMQSSTLFWCDDCRCHINGAVLHVSCEEGYHAPLSTINF